MHPPIYLLPFIPALFGWLLTRICIRYLFYPSKPVKVLGMYFHGILPKHQKRLSAGVAEAVCKELVTGNFLKQNLASADTLQRSMPAIEKHIDHFLNNRLKEEIPVISMFVGEKIINQLKQLFLKELEELFPSVMSQFIGDLSHSEALKQQIVVKLNGIPADAIRGKFYGTFSKDLYRIEWMFAFVGFLAGVIQLLLTILILK